MSQQVETDKWHWIAIGAGVGTTALLLVFLYAPNGLWKLVIAFLLVVTLVVMMMNPRYRLFGLGTAATLTGLAGFITEISLNASATLPGGGVLSAGVEGGTNVHPIFFILVLGIGLATIAFDNVGRGWIWPALQEGDAARPELSLALEAKHVTLTAELADAGQRRFHIPISVSKNEGRPVRLVSVEIKDASILEFGAGSGDGVQTTCTLENSGASDVSILGSFPEAKLSGGKATREIIIVDEFNRRWTAGKITLKASD